MLWGVLSDIHSNPQALDAVLAEMRKRGAAGFLCCGDIVGYGPDPNEVIERLRALPSFHGVLGNHDLAMLGRMNLDWFNEPAREAIAHARKTMTAASRKWLESLPVRVETEKFSIVHGSPRNPAEEYLVTIQQFHDNCQHFKASPCFVGHSHLPLCFLMKEPVSIVESGPLSEGQRVAVPAGVRSVINPGSVGQPRDHDARACAGTYDDEARLFELMRVPYNVKEVQDRILATGLPEFLALRLSYGQ